jgi:hypothetical protein
MTRLPPRRALALAALVLAGCYHYVFEQQPRATAAGDRQLVTYEHRVPTYLNGFIGTGRVDTTGDCAAPVRTELRVTGTDVLISALTLLIYTPHTLYVTCEVPST